MTNVIYRNRVYLGLQLQSVSVLDGRVKVWAARAKSWGARILNHKHKTERANSKW